MIIWVSAIIAMHFYLASYQLIFLQRMSKTTKNANKKVSDLGLIIFSGQSTIFSFYINIERGVAI